MAPIDTRRVKAPVLALGAAFVLPGSTLEGWSRAALAILLAAALVWHLRTSAVSSQGAGARAT
jgi:hypothetical protein